MSMTMTGSALDVSMGSAVAHATANRRGAKAKTKRCFMSFLSSCGSFESGSDEIIELNRMHARVRARDARWR